MNATYTRDDLVRAWDEGYMRGMHPFTHVDQSDPIPPGCFPPDWGLNATPYRKAE